MPELPEVETVKRDLLHAGLVGCQFTSIKVSWPSSIVSNTARNKLRPLLQKPITSIDRRGKYLLFYFENDLMAVHLRMTGRLILAKHQAVHTPHTRIIFHLTNGQGLIFQDPRKFGRVYMPDVSKQQIQKLGPEPLAPSFTGSHFSRQLLQRNRQLKPLLLDQTFLAGLGNIYVDESLWMSQLHPQKIAAACAREEARLLYRSIRKVLRKAINNLGTTLGNGMPNFQTPRGEAGRNRENLNAYGQAELPCRRCGMPLQRIIVGQRGTTICPRCQQ